MPVAWCECWQHGIIVQELQQALLLLKEHSQREEALGAPAWAIKEHREIEQKAEELMRLILVHFNHEANAPY